MLDKVNTYKYAIFGGTFDPIHLAHIKMADCAIRDLQLDELLFMPAYINPFKQDIKTANPQDRLAMIETVLSHNPKFSVSDYEINKKEVSYTIETLEYFESIKTGELYFLQGFDTIVKMDKWYQGEKILRNYPIITAIRPGTDFQDAIEKIEYYKNTFDSKIHILDMPAMDVSSTSIRESIKHNHSLHNQVLKQTEEYIFEHKLYK